MSLAIVLGILSASPSRRETCSLTVCPSRDSQCGTLFLDTQTHLWGLILRFRKLWSFVGISASFGCFRDSCKTARRVIATFLHFLQQVLCWCISLFLHFNMCFLPNLVRNSRKQSLLYTFLWKLIPVINRMEECAYLNTQPPCNCEHTTGIPVVLEYSSDYCFDWLCYHENIFFYQFKNLQLN